jgi:hypothetical protein
MNADMALAKVKKDLAANGAKDLQLKETQLMKAQKDLTKAKADLKKANDLAASATKLEKEMKEMKDENNKIVLTLT